MRDLIDRF